jgi:L-alanine-DL-glutamate epimerase-like enolase superfamily enzyme
MEITGVETIPLSCPIPEDETWRLGGYSRPNVTGVKSDALILRVHTDEGIVGLGEPSPYGGVANLQQAIEDLEPSLTGADPFDVARLANPDEYFGPQFADGPGRYALAGIDIACWDIVGKAAGEPVCKVLGGQYADRVPVYASGGIDWEFLRDPDLLVEEAREYAAEGFDAFKLRIAADERFFDAVERVHEAVGDDLDLIFEGNQRFRTAAEAIRAGERLRAFDPVWFEEPIDSDDLDGYRRLTEALPGLPISGGEMRPSASEFKPWIDAHAYDVVQPDANVMGLTEARRVADVANLEGLLCVPHNWHNAVTTAANLHLAASIPNGDRLEYQKTWHWSAPAFRTEIVTDPLVPEDGSLEVPDEPGLGVELDWDAIEEYAYEEGPCQVPWEDHPF